MSEPNMSSDGNASKGPTTVLPGTPGPNGHGAQAQGPVGPGGPTEKQAQLDAFRVNDEGTLCTTDQGVAVDAHRRLAHGRRARPDAARGLPPPREDHPLRPRAHPGARGPRARRRRARLLPGRTSRWPSTPRPTFLQRPGRADAGVRAVLHRRRARAARPTRRATCAASRRSSTPSEGNFDLVGNNMPVFFIQDGIKFPDLVHAVKPEPHNEIPQAASRARHVLGLRLAAARDDAHDHVGDVRPGDPAQLPDDGGLRRPHLPARQRRRARHAS